MFYYFWYPSFGIDNVKGQIETLYKRRIKNQIEDDFCMKIKQESSFLFIIYKL